MNVTFLTFIKYYIAENKGGVDLALRFIHPSHIISSFHPYKTHGTIWIKFIDND